VSVASGAAREAVREAVTLPLLFLTVALFGGVRAGFTPVTLRFVPPPLFALVLAAILVGLLARTGALAPHRLLNSHRTALENLSGAIVLGTLFCATAQLFNLVMPESGLLHLLFSVFFLALLWNTYAADPDRRRLLRSLLVVFGAAFILKFIVLAALYDESAGLTRRVLTTLLEGVTLGELSYAPEGPLTGYLAFLTIALYLLGVSLLPWGSWEPGGTHVPRRRRDPLAAHEAGADELTVEGEQP
jgi:hypothetical protein